MARRDAEGSVDCARHQRDHRGMDSDESFTLPLPPPPPGVPARDVVYVRSAAEPSEERDHEDIILRRVPRRTAQRYRAAAGGRGLTHAQYLAALVALHELVRERADGADEQLAELLHGLGLQTVTV